jgi:hypothetical protein
MLEMLDRLVPGSETPRSELVNAIVRDLPMKVESWLIESWLTLAAEAGQIELTRRAIDGRSANCRATERDREKKICGYVLLLG